MHRIGLIVDGVTLGKQYHDLICWAEQQSDVEVTALVIQTAPRPRDSGFRKLYRLLGELGLPGTLSRILFSVVVRFEDALTAKCDRDADVDISDRVTTRLRVSPIVSKSGFVYRYTSADVCRIKRLKLDLLIRCGSGILKGDILQAAKHGILSMHHGDNRLNRGGPPGFWEVLLRQPYTGFVVQRLTEELDGGEVLFRGSVGTRNLFLRNQRSVYDQSAPYFHATIRRLLNGEISVEDPLPYDDRLYRSPSAWDVLRYCQKTFLFGIKRALRKLLGIRERWSVGFIEGDWRRAALWRGTVLPNPPGAFLADPFAVKGCDGEHYIFVEDYRFAEARGVISVYKVKDKHCDRLGVALSEHFHLSFPFVFSFNGTMYMCPESSSARQIRLYKCIAFPLQWELARVILDNVYAVDTMIFQRNGRWWMMTNIDDTGQGGTSALFVYHSRSPLDDWEPIANNPAFVDASKGRNGGLLTHGEEMFRVSQRSKFGQYGNETSIHRILHLDEHAYWETKVQTVRPKFRTKIRGIHHLHNTGDLLVYDFWKFSHGR